jgi:acyl-CoA synthetase (AMP-forming)/AMP-acid ligase II
MIDHGAVSVDDERSSICRFLWRAGTDHSRAIAVITDGEPLTYGELLTRARTVAAVLSPEIRENPRIALLAENGPTYVVSYWGILLAGGVTVELNPGLGNLELGWQLRNADPALLIAEGRHEKRLADLDLEITRDRSGGGDSRGTEASRVIAARPSGTVSPELLEGLERALMGTNLTPDSAPAADERTLPGGATLASIVHTSGTTGQVKGVCLSHRNLAWTTVAIADSFGLDRNVEGERFAGNLPLFYTYGKSVLHLATWLAAPVVFGTHLFTPDSFMELIRSRKVTHLSLVPYLCNLLMRSSDFERSSLPDVRRVTIAGGALTREPLLEMLRRFPQQVQPMYGLTVASTRVVCMPAGETEKRPESCGRPIDGVALRVLGEDGAPLPTGQAGEIVLQGPNVMFGYFRDPETTAIALNDGWLRSGDIGSLSEDGYLTISGRRKDMIKIFGESVSAFSIETAIASLPSVAEVAVKGMPHPVSGEAICAFVVPQDGERVSEEEIRMRCATTLGKARVPGRIRIVDELPKTASGKVRKSLLATD